MANKAQSVYSHDVREISTPLSGHLRPQPEHSKNVLLVKMSLGTVRPTCFELPSKVNFQHEYGLPQHRDGITAGDVVGGWAQHDGTANQKPGKDFKALNSMAVIAGGTSSKDMSDFRKSNDVRLKLGTYKPVESKPYDDNTTFGRPGGAKQPFADLISHSHRYEWSANNPPTASEKLKPKKPGSTKTSELLMKVNSKKLEAHNLKDELVYTMQPYWKAPSMEKVPAKVGYTG